MIQSIIRLLKRWQNAPSTKGKTNKHAWWDDKIQRKSSIHHLFKQNEQTYKQSKSIYKHIQIGLGTLAVKP